MSDVVQYFDYSTNYELTSKTQLLWYHNHGFKEHEDRNGQCKLLIEWANSSVAYEHLPVEFLLKKGYSIEILYYNGSVLVCPPNSTGGSSQRLFFEEHPRSGGLARPTPRMANYRMLSNEKEWAFLDIFDPVVDRMNGQLSFTVQWKNTWLKVQDLAKWGVYRAEYLFYYRNNQHVLSRIDAFRKLYEHFEALNLVDNQIEPEANQVRVNLFQKTVAVCATTADPAVLEKVKQAKAANEHLPIKVRFHLTPSGEYKTELWEYNLEDPNAEAMITETVQNDRQDEASLSANYWNGQNGRNGFLASPNVPQ